VPKLTVDCFLIDVIALIFIEKERWRGFSAA
jgi:hypothetical protein